MYGCLENLSIISLIEKIKIGSEEVDVTDLNDAYTSGLDDNTNINSQEI